MINPHATKSVNQEKSQLINRALILELLHQEGVCSRATLSHLSGLRQATITNIVNEFIERGIVTETGLMTGSKGRRSIGVAVCDDHYKVIGVRMTRSAFYVCLSGLSGKIYEVQQYKITPKESVQTTITHIRAAIQNARSRNKETKIPAVCIAMPGPYYEDKDNLFFVTALSGWNNFPIKKALAEGLNLPIYIVNDANASAFAQLWYRSKDYGVQNMIYILAGQGIGSGIIMNGRLVTGQQNLAGEIGHTSINFNGPLCECGNHGCLEKYCSYLVLCRNIAERLQTGGFSLLDPRKITPEKIADAIRQGDTIATEEFEKVCGFLAIGIVNQINQFNPGLIVIGDELAEICPELLLSTVKKHVQNHINTGIYKNVTIEINQLKESPALLGASAIAAHHVLSDPLTMTEPSFH